MKQYWKSKIERYGGKVSNSVSGVTCLVTTPAERERERGGSTKIADALERGIPIVSEDWLIDGIEKMEAQPLEDYDIYVTINSRSCSLSSSKCMNVPCLLSDKCL